VDVWSRQVRWAQLRRASFGGFYMLEALAGPLLPLLFAAFAAAASDVPVAPALAALAMLWYSAELSLAAAAGWPLPLLSPVHAILRDLLLPVLLVMGFSDRAFIWRGNEMHADDYDSTKAA
jgi:ceramide glucosyltransferase